MNSHIGIQLEFLTHFSLRLYKSKLKGCPLKPTEKKPAISWKIQVCTFMLSNICTAEVSFSRTLIPYQHSAAADTALSFPVERHTKREFPYGDQ